MKKLFWLSALFVCTWLTADAQDLWKIVPGKITTPWAEKMDVNNVLPEYPRPQLERNTWKNLNGLWQYAITPKNEEKPRTYDGQILVPFAVESALSGVGKTVGKDSLLWYNTSFTLPASFKNKTVLLHFGAVDWRTEVSINGKAVGEHEGGFTAFTFDITPYLKKGSQELVVKVWDPTDEGPQPRGKQVRKPEGIWYTPVTGIWQTAWLEAVPGSYIASTRQTPDVDRSNLQFEASVKNQLPGDQIRLTAWDGEQKISELLGDAASKMVLPIREAKLWSPSHPFLYQLTIALVRNGKIIDQVKSYFAMRKISLAKDDQGIQRMMLNNQFLFQYGPLDQGWWPDGLYTAPTDEALKFDIEKTKNMGFNMIRKHIKVEPARWYYYCDLLGMLVWQDMPSGDLGNRWDSRPGVFGLATEKNRTAESEKYYRQDWRDIMEQLHNFPSIVTWVPFNEGWGQFKTEEITKWTMQKDPSRLVNSASGGNFFKVGDMVDLHNYPEPAMPRPDIFGKEEAIVLGEFGGLGLPVTDHTWQQKDNWGYQSFKTREELYKKYASFMEKLSDLIPKGLSAAVYTQTTDVEVEVNGLITYDRKVIKMSPEKLKALHDKLYDLKLVKFAEN